MANSTNSSGGGIGFVGLLQILFLGLKLTDTIKWNWFWVLSPTIFAISIIVIVLVAVWYIQEVYLKKK